MIEESSGALVVMNETETEEPQVRILIVQYL